MVKPKLEIKGGGERILYERKERVGVASEIRHDYFSTISRKFLRRKSSIFDKNSARRQMVIFADDYISNKILTHGIYEKQQLDILMGWIRLKHNTCNNVVLDIGANIGNHSLYFSSYFNKCISFEPNPRTFELLKINSKLVDNVLPVNTGLSDEKGEAELNISFNNTGASSLSSDWNRSFDGKVRISLEVLDDVIDPEDKVDLIKIDVEGHEWFALKGAEKTIRKNRPLIVFEYNASDSETAGDKDVLKLLNKFGYREFYEIVDGWESFHKSLRAYPRIFRALVKYLQLLLGKKVVDQILRVSNFEKKQYLMVIASPD